MPDHPLPLDDTSPKRRAILDAAAGLFMSEGFGAVSMDAVARTAQVSKATLYAHFPGKDALFAEIIRSNCLRMQAASTLAFSSHDLPLRQALTEFGEHMVSFLLRPGVRALYRVVVSESARVPELGSAFYEAGPLTLRRWLAAWLAEEAARGRLRPGTEPEVAAEQYLALLRGDLFLRATLGMETTATAEAIGQSVARAVDAFLRIHGAAAPESEGFA